MTGKLYSVVGDWGTGKTLLTTYIALEVALLVLANYEIRCDRWKRLTLDNIFTEAFNCILIIDEAYTWIDSRSSGKDLNKYMSYILEQIRKRGVTIFLTYQELSLIDVRFRRQIDRYIFCSKHGSTDEPYYKYTVMKNANSPRKTWVMPYQIAKKVYDCYNTEEIITPPDFSRVEMNAMAFAEPKDVLGQARLYAGQIVGKVGSNITRERVEIALMEKNISPAYAKVVYNLLKSGL